MASGESRFSEEAERLFEEFLERRAAGAPIEFEPFLREHGDVAADLRAIHSAWEFLNRLEARPREAPSLARQLELKFGGDVDPQVSLGGEDVGEQEFGDSHRESNQDRASSGSRLFERLRAEGPRGTRYRLLGEVARGGMGAILRIWDEDLRRVSAMKVVLGRGDRDERAGSADGTPAVDAKTLGRFLEEAQVTGQLDHPGIVPVHELGLAADGRVYFTMRLVKGVDLRVVFEQVRAGVDGWNETRALGVLLKVCEAMSYAHSKGVVHRDLKPGNVMVGKFGEVYVMDWGLARVVGREDRHDLRLQTPTTTSAVATDRRDEHDERADSPVMTMDGDVVGTPAYMPPEQAQGRLDQIGAHSDVYAVGAMLYQLLSGEMPYVPKGARLSQRTVLASVVSGPPTPLQQLAPRAPAELVAICEKSMARDVARRYADMRELADDLRAYLEHRVVRAHATGTWAETRKWVERNKPLAVSLAAAIVLLAAGIVVSVAARHRAEQRTREAEYQAYVADVRGAQAAYDSGEFADVRRFLDAAPERLRGWEWLHLDSTSDTSLVRFVGHQGEVLAASFNPAGTRVVTASADNTARIWDAATGKELLVLRGHGGRVRSAVFDPAGARVVTASADKTARVWDAVTGAELTVFRGHEDRVRSAEFSPDGTRVLTAAMDTTARIWDATSGLQLASLNGHQGRVTARFSADGRKVVTSSTDNTARLWDATSGALLGILRGHEKGVYNDAGVYDAAFDPTGTRVVTAGFDGTARIWDAITGNQLLVFRGHHQTVWSGCFSPNGRDVITSSDDGTARIWDSTTGIESSGVRGAVAAYQSRFDGSGQHAVCTFNDGTAEVWGVTTRDAPATAMLIGHQDAVSDVAFSSDGTRIVTASWDGTARLWDSASTDGLDMLRGHEDIVWHAEFSRDGARIVTASEDGTARVWDALSGRQLAVLRGHQGGVLVAAFNPNGMSIATASSDGTVRLWSLMNGGGVIAACDHGTRVGDVAFSPDGSTFLTGSENSTARLFDATTGNEIGLLQTPPRVGGSSETAVTFGPMAVAFSPDGTRAATSSGIAAVTLWDVKSRASLRVFGPFLDFPITLRFTPDGSKLLIAVENVVREFDCQSGKEVSVLHGHLDSVVSAISNADSTRIVTSSFDKTMRIWDAATSVELAELHGHTGRLTYADISPDGSRIVSTSFDKTARIWDSAPRFARLQALRELKDAETDARRALERWMAICNEWSKVGESLRTDPTLSPIVRRVALDLLLQTASQRREEAWTWVQELRKRKFLRAPIEETVRADAQRDAHVRDEALRWTEKLDESPAAMNRLVREAIRDEKADPEVHASALRAIEAAAKQRPDDPEIAGTLGMAQFRNGKYREAAATLARVLELAKSDRPAELAFLAMARFRLGDVAAASEMIVKLESMMQQESWRNDAESKAATTEAEALVEKK